MIVGGYSLDLYCENLDGDTCKNPRPKDGLTHPAEYYSQTFGECARMAREDGWRLNRKKGTAICPWCTGKRKP